MTKLYFEKLGPAYCGSVVPLCSMRDFHAPGERIQNYPGALQDLQYVLSLIGERPKGASFFILRFLIATDLLIFPFIGYTEHSMKRGGASEAALNGASLEELRDAGHWTSVRTASKYVADTSTAIRKFNDYLTL